MADTKDICDQISCENNISCITEELKCPICLSTCKDPKLTECNHVFCEYCLSQYVENHEDNYPPCPFCKTILRISKTGVGSMFTEQHYKNIIWNLQWPDFSFQEFFKECRKELICRECNRFYIDPRRLECGHVFCLSCLQDHTERTPSSELFINCPRCSCHTLNLPNGLVALNIDPLFLRIQHLVTVINVGNEESLLKRQCGGICNSVKLVCVKCETCKKVYCESCLKQHSHYMRDCLTFRLQLASDRQTDISESNSSSETDDSSGNGDSLQEIKERDRSIVKPSHITPGHTHKLLQLYCKTCDEPVCKHCKGVDHYGHETCDIRDFDEQLQRWLPEIIVKLEKQKEKLKTEHDLNTKNRNQFLEKRQSIKNQAITQVEKVKMELDRKLSEHLLEIDNSTNAFEEHFKNSSSEEQYRLSETDKFLDFLKKISPRCLRGLHLLKQDTSIFLELQRKYIEEKLQQFGVELLCDGQLENLLVNLEGFEFGECHIQQELHSFHETICTCSSSEDQTDASVVEKKKYRLSEEIGKKVKTHITTITCLYSPNVHGNTAEGQQCPIRKSNSKGYSVTLQRFVPNKKDPDGTEIKDSYICRILDQNDGTCLEKAIEDVSEIFYLAIDTNCNVIIGIQSSSTNKKMLLLYSSDGKRTEELRLPRSFDRIFQRECGKLVVCDGNRHHLVQYLP